MKFLLASVALLFCSGALAEGGNATSPGNNQGGVRTDAPKTDNVPTGGCMPIGLTARGEMVFPMQCREILERERGPAPDDLTLKSQPVAQPVVQQEVAAPEQLHLRAPVANRSAVRHRKRPPAQAQIQPQARSQVIGSSTAKKP
jgi:hypothetical protein